jgi:predicted ester cyclase
VDGRDNKSIVRRLFEAFDAVDTAALDRLLSGDFVAHGLSPSFSEDREGWKRLAAHWAAGFSDEELNLEDLIGEDDKVAVRWTSRVTHTGEVFGTPPTNRRVTVKGIEIYRLSGQRVVEYWGEMDLTDLTNANDAPDTSES